MQYLGYCTVCNTSNPSRSFNPTVPYLDTSPKDKKTILPLKNLTPAHSVSGLPAHYFIKHKLKFSLSPAQLHLFNPLSQLHVLQSIATAASPSIEASLFAITVASKAPAKLQAHPIPTPTKKTHLALQQQNFLPLSRV